MEIEKILGKKALILTNKELQNLELCLSCISEDEKVSDLWKNSKALKIFAYKLRCVLKDEV